MELGLRERVALVTAASKGMGRAVALGLAQEGARLALCARGEAALMATAEEIRAATGAEVWAMPADVSRPADVEQLVGAAQRHFGGIDVLVCNAGGPPPGRFADFPDDAPWEQAFQQNLMSVVRLCRAVLPGMRERHWGRIVTITSLTVKEPSPTLALSNVMRAGVTSLVKTLANEHGPDGVLVNNVLPSAVLTERAVDLARRQAEAAGRSVEEQLQESAARIPLRRIATPEEFAQVVIFLASMRNTYITGATIPVDGGAMKALM